MQEDEPIPFASYMSSFSSLLFRWVTLLSCKFDFTRQYGNQYAYHAFACQINKF